MGKKNDDIFGKYGNRDYTQARKKKGSGKNDGELHDPGDILAIVTKTMKQYGKLKGKNKKILAYGCGHHILKKNGKPDPRIETRKNKAGQQYLHCKICGADFTGTLLTDKQLEDALRKPQDIIQQMKFIVHSSGGDRNAVRFVTEASILLYRLPKVYKNMRKVVSKQEELKKAGKKKRYSNDSSFGTWG